MCRRFFERWALRLNWNCCQVVNHYFLPINICVSLPRENETMQPFSLSIMRETYIPVMKENKQHAIKNLLSIMPPRQIMKKMNQLMRQLIFVLGVAKRSHCRVGQGCE